MNNIENVKNKIKKLLALAERGSEHEAKIAAAKAQQLMAEYKFSQKAFMAAESKVIKRVTDLYYTGYRNNYRNTLANSLSKFYCCNNYISTPKGSTKHYLALIGLEEDIQILESVLVFADSCVNDWFKEYKKTNGWKYSSEYLNALKNQYGRGFAIGLKELLGTQAGQIEQEWGLVMAVPKEAAEYTDDLKPLNLKLNICEDEVLYSQGYKDGYNAPIQNKVAWKEGEKDDITFKSE